MKFGNSCNDLRGLGETFRKIRNQLGKKKSLGMRKLLELLPEFLPDTLQVAGVVAPLGPTRGNRLKNEVHVRGLALIFEQLRVFVVLDAVADGLQAYARCRFTGRDRTRRGKENPIAWPAETAAAGIRIQIVPAPDGVSGGPPVGAVVKNPRGALGPVEESRLDALVDRRIVHQP